MYVGQRGIEGGRYRVGHFIPTNVSLNVEVLCFDVGEKASDEGGECTLTYVRHVISKFPHPYLDFVGIGKITCQCQWIELSILNSYFFER